MKKNKEKKSDHVETEAVENAALVNPHVKKRKAKRSKKAKAKREKKTDPRPSIDLPNLPRDFSGELEKQVKLLLVRFQGPRKFSSDESRIEFIANCEAMDANNRAAQKAIHASQKAQEKKAA